MFACHADSKFSPKQIANFTVFQLTTRRHSTHVQDLSQRQTSISAKHVMQNKLILYYKLKTSTKPSYLNVIKHYFTKLTFLISLKVVEQFKMT